MAEPHQLPAPRRRPCRPRGAVPAPVSGPLHPVRRGAPPSEPKHGIPRRRLSVLAAAALVPAHAEDAEPDPDFLRGPPAARAAVADDGARPLRVRIPPGRGHAVWPGRAHEPAAAEPPGGKQRLGRRPVSGGASPALLPPLCRRARCLGELGLPVGGEPRMSRGPAIPQGPPPRAGHPAASRSRRLGGPAQRQRAAAHGEEDAPAPRGHPGARAAGCRRCWPHTLSFSAWP
mmetsp:Transcript_1281/g.3066  ORF Transcript_1281/g.3066 Transcript_1281/m.3066 type:complete len:231 (+) Transcript_1281:1578-2270(+)